MYTFICEDSPNGILSGIYDAWAFKIEQNRRFRSGNADNVAAFCTHEDISLLCREPDNYELFCDYLPVAVSPEKSDKVARTILNRLGMEFYETLINAILAITPEHKKDIDKADAAYKTVVYALNSSAGAQVLHDLANPYIHRIFTLSRATHAEAHHLMGFLRFSELDNGVLFSTIHPKNNALPYLAEHFTDRLPQENFIIYDENRRTAAVHSAGKNFMLVDASDLNQDILKHYSEQELEYRALWQTFFESIAIKARINPKLQASNIPKRFWGDTVELCTT